MYFLKTFLVFLLQYIYSCSFNLLCQSVEIHSGQTRIIFFLAKIFFIKESKRILGEDKIVGHILNARSIFFNPKYKIGGIELMKKLK